MTKKDCMFYVAEDPEQPGAGWTDGELARGKRFGGPGIEYHCRDAYYLD